MQLPVTRSVWVGVARWIAHGMGQVAATWSLLRRSCVAMVACAGSSSAAGPRPRLMSSGCCTILPI
eukprot:3120270-Karenia_brevis.AAC.1